MNRLISIKTTNKFSFKNTIFILNCINPKNYLSIISKAKIFYHFLKNILYGFYNTFVKLQRILANISITLKILILEN
jgi:hypothetical protein